MEGRKETQGGKRKNQRKIHVGAGQGFGLLHGFILAHNYLLMKISFPTPRVSFSPPKI
jgi:hypothetical protein